MTQVQEPTLAAVDAPPVGELGFITLADLCAQVDAAGPRRWLLRGIWPAGDYGVHGAQEKAQKTWATVDLAVSVASDTPWLDAVPIDDAGPVLMLHGEGSSANLVRRIRAVCAARDLKAEELPIVICTRAPHLSNRFHLIEIAAKLDEVRPKLVTLDPLYLAARGANSASLNEMGGLLEGPQQMCQEASASLWVAAHHNRRGDASGARRLSGAGPAEWGRVIVSATVVSRHTNPTTKETTVVTQLDVIGGEVADQGLRVVRRIRADDPDDLDSPLHYHVRVDDTPDDTPAADGGEERMPPARAKLLEALRASACEPKTGPQLVDWISEHHGHGLTRQTWSRELNALADAGLADRLDQGPGRGAMWTIHGTTP